MAHKGEDGIICSIDRVQDELLAGNDTEDLVQWVKNSLSREFFFTTNSDIVISAYKEIMLWVQQHSQYLDMAKAKFATEADGWLVAYAMSEGKIIVTNEQSRPTARNRILLPDVCKQFHVNYEDTFSLLKKLNIQFTWKPGDNSLF